MFTSSLIRRSHLKPVDDETVEIKAEPLPRLSCISLVGRTRSLAIISLIVCQWKLPTVNLRLCNCNELPRRVLSNCSNTTKITSRSRNHRTIRI